MQIFKASKTWKSVSRPREIDVEEERSLADFSNIPKFAPKKDSAKKMNSPKRNSPKKASPEKEQPIFYGNIKVLGKARRKPEKENKEKGEMVFYLKKILKII